METEVQRKLKIVKALSSDSSLDAKLALLEYDYKMVHKTEFGQRIFTAHDYKREPTKGSEIFVGHLPRYIYEDTLIPLFSSVGKIYEMRLMLEFSGLNRGFCFIVFKNPDIANVAISMFHGYRIEAENICVYKSLNNCRLYLSNVPLTIGLREIEAELRKLFCGVVEVLVKDASIPADRHRGHVFIDFETHKHAMEARKAMWPSKLRLHNQQVGAEWAKPDRSPLTRNQTTLIVRNVPPNVSKEALVRFVGKRIYRDSTVLNVFYKKGQDTALLEFATVGYAEMALHELNRVQWKGHVLEVSWFRKVDIAKMEKQFDLSGWRDEPAKQTRPAPPNAVSTSSDEEDMDTSSNLYVSAIKNWSMARSGKPPSDADEPCTIRNDIENFKTNLSSLDEIWNKHWTECDKTEARSEYFNNFEPPKPAKRPPKPYSNPFNNEPFSYFSDNDATPFERKETAINTNPYAASSCDPEQSANFSRLTSPDFLRNFHKTFNIHADDPTLQAYQEYMKSFEKDYIVEKIIGQWILYKKLLETIQKTNNLLCYEEALRLQNGFLLTPIDVSALFAPPKVDLAKLRQRHILSQRSGNDLNSHLSSASNQALGNAYIPLPHTLPLSLTPQIDERQYYNSMFQFPIN